MRETTNRYMDSSTISEQERGRLEARVAELEAELKAFEVKNQILFRENQEVARDIEKHLQEYGSRLFKITFRPL